MYCSVDCQDPDFLFARVSPLLDLHSSLTLHTGSAAHRGANVSHGVSLDIVPLPGLLSEEEGGDAWHEAAQQAVQKATLPQVIGCTIGLTGPTAESKTTWTEMFQLNIFSWKQVFCLYFFSKYSYLHIPQSPKQLHSPCFHSAIVNRYYLK